jgi:phosphohistidine phosphatase
MTRRLLVLRHAKSSWDDANVADHDRPLNARGEAAARAMGRFLAHRAGPPALALVSTARRARETFDGLGLELPVSYERELYLAPCAALLARIAKLEDDVACALVIGHNPGLEELVCALTGEGRPRPRRRLEKGLKTATLAELALPIAHWSELAPGIGRLQRFTRPKDLRD